MEWITEQARAYQEVLVQDRRWLHQHPEVGFDLPETCAYVRSRLEDMGYCVQEVCESGLVVEAGNPETGLCVLLRADMDALPMAEETDLPYAASNGCMHACGHDGHIAMMLGAAQLLKEHEAALPGLVRIVFQPDEEATAPTDDTGSTALVEAGVLENPAVQAAFALHLFPTDIPTGSFATRKGALFSSADDVEIIIKGKGCHGSSPQKGVDPLAIASFVFMGTEHLLAREVRPADQAALTFGKLEGGSAANIIPEQALLLGTLRTVSEKVRMQVQKRTTEMVEKLAEAFGGSAHVAFLRGVPPVENDPRMTELAESLVEALFGESVIELDEPVSASDDLAVISQKVPTCYLLLGCGVSGKESFGLHHPQMHIDESVLFKGAALMAACAIQVLSELNENN